MKLTTILVLKIRLEKNGILNIYYEWDATSAKSYLLKGKNLKIKHINAIKYMF